MSSALERRPPTIAAGPTLLTASDPPRTRHLPVRLRFVPRFVDPLVVGLVALGIYALHGYQGLLNRDFGVFTYGGEHVARGVPPYVGIFNSVGPLADAVPGAAIWSGDLVGLSPVLSERILFTLLSAACCSLVCVLARDTFGSRAAGFVAPAVFLVFERFLQLATDGPREKTAMLVFLLAALILVGRQRWLTAGIGTALATLTWQPALAVAVAAVVVAVLVGQRARARPLARFLVGGAIPSLVTVLYFAAAGALRPAIEGFVLVNLEDTTQPSALTSPGPTWSMLWRDYHATLIVELVGLVALLLLAVSAVPSLRCSTSPVARRLVTVGAGAAAGSVWTVLVINGGPDLFVLLPFGALGVTGLVMLLARRATRRIRTCLVAAVVCLGVVTALAESVGTRNHDLVQERADIAAVLATQPSAAQVLSIDAPEVLAISQRDNPTRYQLFDAPMDTYFDRTRPGGLASYAREIGRLRPAFVVVGKGHGGPWLTPVLARDYWRVGSGTDWTWYLSRTAGADALLRARAANASAMGAGPNDLATARAPGRVRLRD